MSLSRLEKEWIGAFLIHADTVTDHKDDEICLAADLVYGWGPDASDWEDSKTPALEALHKLFYGQPDDA